MLFKVLKTEGNSMKEAMKAHVITKSSKQLPVIGHLRDRALITLKIGV